MSPFDRNFALISLAPGDAFESLACDLVVPKLDRLAGAVARLFARNPDEYDDLVVVALGALARTLDELHGGARRTFAELAMPRLLTAIREYRASTRQRYLRSRVALN